MILAIKKRKKSNNTIKLFFIFSLVFAIAYLLYLKKDKQDTSVVETPIEIQNIQNAKEEQEKEKQRLIRLENERKEQEKQNIQRVILIEAEQVVALVGQEYIEDIKILKNKIVYICKPNTNIEAITIRYGANALVKRSYNEIVVVVDIEYILKGRLR